MSRAFLDHLANELAQIERDGLTKHERQIATPQDAVIRVPAARRSSTSAPTTTSGSRIIPR